MSDDLADLAYSKVFLAMYLASWLVANTAVPERYYGTVVGVLLAVSTVFVVAACEALGIPLTRDRCGAATNDGDQCSRDARSWKATFCWQHRHAKELHEDAVEQTVSERVTAWIADARGEAEPETDTDADRE